MANISSPIGDGVARVCPTTGVDGAMRDWEKRQLEGASSASRIPTAEYGIDQPDIYILDEIGFTMRIISTEMVVALLQYLASKK